MTDKNWFLSDYYKERNMKRQKRKCLCVSRHFFQFRNKLHLGVKWDIFKGNLIFYYINDIKKIKKFATLCI